MAEVKLYSGTYCFFCKRVEKFIEENGLENKIPVVYIDESPESRNKLIEGGGKQQVPCLFSEGKWIYESNDIINFIKKNYL